MERKQVQEMQAKLAAHRLEQQNTNQDHPSTSYAKEIDPAGQPFPDQEPAKPAFERAHDNRQEEPAKENTQTQDQASKGVAPSLNMEPSKMRQMETQAKFSEQQQQALKLNEAIKARHESQDHGKMNDGKDHD